MGTREGVAAPVACTIIVESSLLSRCFPFGILRRGFSGVGKAGESVVLAVTNGVRYIMALPGAIIRAAAAQLGRLGVSLWREHTRAPLWIGSAISASFGQAARSVTRATTSLLSALSGVTGFASRSVSTKTLCTSLSKALVKTVTSVRGIKSKQPVSLLERPRRDSGSENLSLYLSKISPGVAGVCSRCGTVVKSGVISLAARSVHAQAVALETVKRLVTRCPVIKSGVMSLAARSDNYPNRDIEDCQGSARAWPLQGHGIGFHCSGRIMVSQVVQRRWQKRLFDCSVVTMINKLTVVALPTHFCPF